MFFCYFSSPIVRNIDILLSKPLKFDYMKDSSISLHLFFSSRICYTQNLIDLTQIDSFFCGCKYVESELMNIRTPTTKTLYRKHFQRSKRNFCSMLISFEFLLRNGFNGLFSLICTKDRRRHPRRTKSIFSE